MDAELSRLNRAEESLIPIAHRDYVIGKKTMGIVTDAPSRRRRATALNLALARAQAMVCEDLTVQELNAEILRLQKSLPEVVQEEIRGQLAAILCA